MKSRSRPTYRQAVLQSVLTALVFAALLGAAVVAPIPMSLMPVVVAVCVGVPVVVAWQMSRHSVAARPVEPLDEDEVDELLRQLDGLPEVHHPHGY